jgi:hypothetical protein
MYVVQKKTASTLAPRGARMPRTSVRPGVEHSSASRCMRYVQKFTHWLPLWPLQPGEAFLASGGFFAAAVQQQKKETVTAKE